LVSIGRILLLVAKLLLFGQCFPLVLHVERLVLPLLADDFGDLRVREPRVLGDDAGLMVLTV